MRAIKIVEVLPDGQFFLEIHVVTIREELIELVLVTEGPPIGHWEWSSYRGGAGAVMLAKLDQVDSYTLMHFVIG